MVTSSVRWVDDGGKGLSSFNGRRIMVDTSSTMVSTNSHIIPTSTLITYN